MKSLWDKGVYKKEILDIILVSILVGELLVIFAYFIGKAVR